MTIEKALVSGVTAVGLGRKAAMVAGALIAYEGRFPYIEMDSVEYIMAGNSFISAVYTINGDDDWVTIVRKSDGAKFVFDGDKLRHQFDQSWLESTNHA